MKIAWLTWIAASMALAGDQGMAPRPDPANYPAHATAQGVTIAAAAVPPEQLKKTLNADLNRAGYVVIEVAIYAEANREAEISLVDFMLRTPPDASTTRPAEPAAVAAAVIPYDKHKTVPASLPGNIQVYSDTTIGYESGTPGRRGRVYAEEGVAVTNAPPPPPPRGSSPSKDQRRDDLQIALTDSALPAGKIRQPVAGYLYFPKPAGRRKADAYELTWYGPDGTVRLAVKAIN